MKRASLCLRPQSAEVVRLERSRLPRAIRKHISSQIGGLFRNTEGELGCLVDLEAEGLVCLNELALLQIGEDLLVGERAGVLDGL